MFDLIVLDYVQLCNSLRFYQDYSDFFSRFSHILMSQFNDQIFLAWYFVKVSI